MTMKKKMRRRFHASIRNKNVLSSSWREMVLFVGENHCVGERIGILVYYNTICSAWGNSRVYIVKSLAFSIHKSPKVQKFPLSFLFPDEHVSRSTIPTRTRDPQKIPSFLWCSSFSRCRAARETCFVHLPKMIVLGLNMAFFPTSLTILTRIRNLSFFIIKRTFYASHITIIIEKEINATMHRFSKITSIFTDKIFPLPWKKKKKIVGCWNNL